MNTIDQRILIPSPPEVVWDYLGDLTKTPEWQADCKAVSFLTSKRNGPGTRLRISSDKGQDRVVEITAWYDGLGYQYTYVDGVPYRESTGRIRLQEIPEGTVVQWTFTYDVGGLRFGLSRQIETAMETSLKSLWKQVSQSSGAQKIREAKSLMRDAPDYEARAQYKPRHPTVIDGKNEDGSPATAEQAGPTQPIPTVPSAPLPPPQPMQAISGPVIDEPPFDEEDTRPRRPAAASPAPAPMPDELFDTTHEPDFLFRPPQSTGLPDELFETTSEPDFLDDHARFAPPAPAAPATPLPTADTQPIKPITDADIAAAEVADEAKQTAEVDIFAPTVKAVPPADEPPKMAAPVIAEPTTEEQIHAPETDLATVETPSEPVAVDQPEDLSVEPSQDITMPVTPTEAPTQAISVEPPKPESKPDITPTTRTPSRDEINKLDTAKLSIWEIFGVQRPSEAPPAPPEPEPKAVAEPVAETVTSAPEMPVADISADDVKATVKHEAVSAAVEAAPVTETSTPIIDSIRSYDLPTTSGGHRGGLRMRMRRKTVKLRFPQ